METKYKAHCGTCKKKMTHSVFLLSKMRGARLKCNKCGTVKSSYINLKNLEVVDDGK